ncbi:MAG TPA: hypothetical protein VHY20_14910, partial [Pirellulales bacterium]|nr:hypothetical protein [Pirellulales bacterium]
SVPCGIKGLEMASKPAIGGESIAPANFLQREHITQNVNLAQTSVKGVAWGMRARSSPVHGAGLSKN